MTAPSINRQWLTSQNGVQNLSLASSPMPNLGPNSILVRTHALALNYRDTEVIAGLYNHHSTTGAPPSSLVPGSDICGSVVASSSSLWKVGDQVLSIFNQTHQKGQVTEEDMKSGLGLPLEGCLQEYRVFGENGVVRKPSYLTDEEAATLPIAALTAWMAVNGFRPLGKPGGRGETVLIQGTGGVAISGLGIAKASGMTVIITSSSDEKLAKAKALGADFGINYRTSPDWHLEVLRLTNGRGVDVIFENGGASTIKKSFECIAFGGLINCIGYLSGKGDEGGTNVNVLALKRNVTLKGLLNGPKERFEEMLDFYEKHEIRPVVEKCWGFEEVKDAVGWVEQGGHFGKVVIKFP